MSYLEDLFSLKGKVVVMTGGSRGIGQVAAHGFAMAGAEVAILCRTSAEETLSRIAADGGKAYHIEVDVTDEVAVNTAFAEVLKRSGSVDVVFNNAGISVREDSLTVSIEDFRKVVDVNLVGEFIIARTAGRIMIERGIKGSIINMASMSGSIVNIPNWQSSYNASKAAVMHLSRSLAVEWADHGIRVNSISPGYIATPMVANISEDMREAWLRLTPTHRMGKPEELMTALLYLASPASGYTTGSDVVVDGAYTAF